MTFTIREHDDNHFIVVGDGIKNRADEMKDLCPNKGAKWSKSNNGVIVRNKHMDEIKSLLGLTKKKSITKERPAPAYPDLTTIFVDGGMNKQTGDCAWGSVVNGEAKDLLGHFLHLAKGLPMKKVNLPVGPRYIIECKFAGVTQQNNAAELISMLYALRIAKSTGLVKRIGSDSQLIIEYWSKGHVNPATKKKMDKDKLCLLEECATLRKEFDASGGVIFKESGATNPADLGYH